MLRAGEERTGQREAGGETIRIYGEFLSWKGGKKGGREFGAFYSPGDRLGEGVLARWYEGSTSRTWMYRAGLLLTRKLWEAPSWTRMGLGLVA